MKKNLIIYTALIGQNEGLNKQPIFKKCKFRNLSGGIVSIHSGWKF